MSALAVIRFTPAGIVEASVWALIVLVCWIAAWREVTRQPQVDGDLVGSLIVVPVVAGWTWPGVLAATMLYLAVRASRRRHLPAERIPRTDLREREAA